MNLVMRLQILYPDNPRKSICLKCKGAPNFCLTINGMIWSMFLKYLARMHPILILSKFSGQIGSKPKRFLFASKFDWSGSVNGSALILLYCLVSYCYCVCIYFCFCLKGPQQLVQYAVMVTLPLIYVAKLNTYCTFPQKQIYFGVPILYPY
jgi:hypothetical protein